MCFLPWNICFLLCNIYHATIIWTKTSDTVHSPINHVLSSLITFLLLWLLPWHLFPGSHNSGWCPCCIDTALSNGPVSLGWFYHGDCKTHQFSLPWKQRNSAIAESIISTALFTMMEKLGYPETGCFSLPQRETQPLLMAASIQYGHHPRMLIQMMTTANFDCEVSSEAISFGLFQLYLYYRYIKVALYQCIWHTKYCSLWSSTVRTAWHWSHSPIIPLIGYFQTHREKHCKANKTLAKINCLGTHIYWLRAYCLCC